MSLGRRGAAWRRRSIASERCASTDRGPRCCSVQGSRIHRRSSRVGSRSRRRARGSRTRAAAELVARTLDNALLRRLFSDVFFQIAELRMNLSSGLTKWGSPRIMHSLVMLIATRNQASAPRAAACTGRAWSGSGRPGGQYRRDRRSGWSGQSMAAVVASQMCQVRETLRTHEEDTARKQSIPHPRGAPDS